MKTARTDFFNQVSMAEDTSHSGETILGKNTEARQLAEDRAEFVTSVLSDIAYENLSFKTQADTWAQKHFSGEAKRKSTAQRAVSDGVFIDVIDLAPGYRPSHGIVADGSPVIDRYIVIQDATQPEGARSTVILHLSPTHAPVVSLITDGRREDGAFTTTRLVTNQPYEGLDHMIAEVHNFVGHVGRQTEVPEWVRNFDEKFIITGDPQGYPTGPGLNNRRLAAKLK